MKRLEDDRVKIQKEFEEEQAKAKAKEEQVKTPSLSMLTKSNYSTMN